MCIMKVSLNWLKDYVSAGVSAGEFARRLTMAGLEVEKVTPFKGDTVFELEITPNRPDCLSILGIAREAAAIFNKSRKFPAAKDRVWPREQCAIRIDDRAGCARYIGTVIEGVAVQKTAAGIAKRLEALGVRSINNIVDITNFCLMETGQPLHAFDYDKLAGGEINVRRARSGEKIITLDNVERVLDPSILVIADGRRPVAIAGIMGGKDTEVTADTKNIILESAAFDPVLIRRASRKLGLSSDSSYRFERGIDGVMVQYGAGRAVDMILDAAGGRVTKRADVSSTPFKAAIRPITLSAANFNQRVGASVTSGRIKTILTKLDFKVITSGGSLKATPPPFRNDVKTDVDIIEEVSRIIGYDNLPLRLPEIKISHVPADEGFQNKRDARGVFSAQGFCEVITYTMIGAKMLEQSRMGEMDRISVLNPLTQDQEVMRPSLLPGLLAVALSNINRGQKNLKLFELGKIYTRKGERDVLGLIMTGTQADDWRRPQKEPLDYFDLKGAVTRLFERFDIPMAKLVFEPLQSAYYAQGQAAAVSIGAQRVGESGKVEEEVLSAWNIRQENVYFVQIELDAVFKGRLATRRYKRISELPAVNRDISLAVQGGITARDVERSIHRTVKSQDRVALAGLKFVEKYEGDKLPAGSTGLIFSLTYQSRTAKTLRDDEVSEVHARVCRDLISGLGVVQR